MTKPQVSDFGSVDPAPPMQKGTITQWSSLLLDENARMFERMRAVFALRNHSSNESVNALCRAFSCKSALLRHEIAYVLGQMQNATAVPRLKEVLDNETEHVMVRHEAAEALGAIVDRSAIEILTKYLNDPQPEISESCEVALDLLDHVNDKSVH